MCGMAGVRRIWKYPGSPEDSGVTSCQILMAMKQYAIKAAAQEPFFVRPMGSYSDPLCAIGVAYRTSVPEAARGSLQDMLDGGD